MSDIGMIRLSDPDGHSWLGQYMPLETRVVRELTADDGGQYILAELTQPIIGPDGPVSHLVVGGRIVGKPLTPGIGGTPTNIAFVNDMSILQDTHLNFSKAKFTEIGFGSCIPAVAMISKGKRSKKHFSGYVAVVILVLVALLVVLAI